MESFARLSLPFLRYGATGGLRNLFGAIVVTLTATLPAVAEPVTIAALGDSLTQGYGLPVEDGFVPQLQAWLTERGADVSVLNAGVSGDTTAGGLSRADWTMTDDVDALIVNLGGNDLLRGIEPEASRANLTGILEKAKTKGLPVLLIGLPGPGNFGPDYKAEFDAIYPDLSDAYDTLLLPNYFAVLAAADTGMPDPVLMQADGIHPNAEGVRRLVDAVGPQVMELVARVKK